MHLALSSAPAWSFAGRPDTKLESFVPGPGNYDPQILKFEKSPTYRIGTSGRDSPPLSTTPGPGTYEPKSPVTSKSSISIGTSKRPPLSEAPETPGPGTYLLPSTLAKGPKFSMTGRPEVFVEEVLPGPGHYDHYSAYTKDRAPAYGMGSGARTERSKSEIGPGPGAYDSPIKTSGPKWAFGSQPRKENQSIDGPGPGAYRLPGSLSTQGASISGKRLEFPLSDNPGPGSYNSGELRSTSPFWSIGKSPRGEFLKVNKLSPGPGAYSLSRDLDVSAPVFGTSERQPLTKIIETPGPGEYLAVKKPNAPAYSMRPKTAVVKNKDNFPGPGQYNPNKTCGDIKWSVGKDTKRLDIAKGGNVPGPGYYDINKKLAGPKWVFSSAKRGSIKKKEVTPGPGSYTNFSTIGNIPNYAKRQLG